jgi:hypothetical protein
MLRPAAEQAVRLGMQAGHELALELRTFIRVG